MFNGRFTDTSGDIAYLSTFIDVAPTLATARFDALLRSLGSGRGVLVLDPEPTPSSSLRSATGTLRSTRGSNLGAVQIELDVWSEGRTQIGIRPTRDKSGSAAAYFTAGYAVLDELAQCLAADNPWTPGSIVAKRSVATRRRAAGAVQAA